MYLKYGSQLLRQLQVMSLMAYNHNGRYSQKVTKLETANFSHPFYGTPRFNTFMTCWWLQIWNKMMKIKSNLFWNKNSNPFHN